MPELTEIYKERTTCHPDCVYTRSMFFEIREVGESSAEWIAKNCPPFSFKTSKPEKPPALYSLLAHALLFESRWEAAGNTKWANYYHYEVERIRRKIRPESTQISAETGTVRAEVRRWVETADRQRTERYAA